MGLDQAEIHKIPKTWEKWILVIWEKYGEKNILKNFGCNRNPYNSKNMGKADFHSTWISMVKYSYFKFIGFLNISCEAQIHSIPKIWENWIYLVWEKYGKTQRFPIFFAILQT